MWGGLQLAPRFSSAETCNSSSPHLRRKIKTVRRTFLWAIVSVFIRPVLRAAGIKPVPLRGRLRQPASGSPLIETGDGRRIQLEGDEPTQKVLADERLKDSDFEVLGESISGDRFDVQKIHIPSLFVYVNGKRMQVSYWCDVCYIRTSSPGKCWCCQKYTDLDPIQPES
jgi:hypothetical protein